MLPEWGGRFVYFCFSGAQQRFCNEENCRADHKDKQGKWFVQKNAVSGGRIRALRLQDDAECRFARCAARSRWLNPREGIIKRSDYIYVMIEAHIIDRMDFYLLERVCDQLEEWSGTEYGTLFISCEIRKQTISRKDFAKRLIEITSLYHFDHKNLVLELSEAALDSCRR